MGKTAAKKNKITLGKFLFDYLYAQGIKDAFGIPGDFVLPTMRWLDASKINLITMTHEPSVGFAADGYARVHGLGLAIVTYCVGGLNMLNPVACAYAEKSPVIIISGGPSPAERRKDHLIHHKVRTFDTQRRIFEEVTCANTVLTDPETAASEIMRVVEEVKKQCRPGYIEVPYDVVDMPITIPTIAKPKEPIEIDEESLDVCMREAAEKINKAKTPVLLADLELHRHGLTDLAIKIAEKFNLPIAGTLMSKSGISEKHPLYIGVYSGAISEPGCRDYVDSSDCVLLLGAFITDMMLGINTAKITRKKSILATTEETRIGLHYYEGIPLKTFLEGLLNAPIKKRPGFKNPNPYSPPKPVSKQELSKPMDMEAFFRILELEMPKGATIVSDVGDAIFGTIGLRTDKHSNFLGDAYYLSMGFAVPAAIGVMTAKPKEPVITIVGDGAFQMTGIELSTVAKLKMKPTILLLNNSGYGTQRYIIDGKFNDIHPWDYTKTCELIRYGVSKKIRTRGEFIIALQEAKHAKEMTFLEIIVPRADCSVPLKRLATSLSEIRDASKRVKKEKAA